VLEAVQYALWAVSDCVILAGYPFGFGLRLIPNVIYYAGFLAVVALTIPDGPRLRHARPVLLSALGVGLAIAVVGGRMQPPAKGAKLPAATLQFLVDGAPLANYSLEALVAQVSSETWTAFDPYYKTDKTFVALPLLPLLQQVFASTPYPLPDSTLVFRARDGYMVTLAGNQVLEGGAYLAFGEGEPGRFSPIGEKAADPGPFYLVWKHSHQNDQKSYPRPWQITSIELRKTPPSYAKAQPPGVASDSPEALGFALFKTRCIRCHSINHEGGRVGPELNLPRNILEYRSREDVIAFVRDPLAFRYSVMPAHNDFSSVQFDHLLAYLAHMQHHKDIP
jgi:mono/diheme cytochrome c family protein